MEEKKNNGNQNGKKKQNRTVNNSASSVNKQKNGNNKVNTQNQNSNNKQRPKQPNNKNNYNGQKNNGGENIKTNKKNNNSKNYNNKNSSNKVKNNNPNRNVQKSNQNSNKKNNTNYQKQNGNVQGNKSSNKVNENKKEVKPQNQKQESKIKVIKKVEEDEITKKDEVVKKENEEKKDNLEDKKSGVSIIVILVIVFIFLVVIGSFILNLFGSKIQSNVLIDGIDVSRLTSETAKNKIEEQYNFVSDSKLVYTYNGVEYEINLSDIDFEYCIDDAIHDAMNVGRGYNIILAMKDFYFLRFSESKNIDLKFKYNQEELKQKIKDIEANFYQEVEQYSYVVEEGKVKIKNGKPGIEIIYEEFEKSLELAIENKNFEDKIEIPIKIEEQKPIDVAEIHSAVYVEMVNAYYTIEPFEIHQEVTGVNFDVSVLKQMIDSEPEKEEYCIDLVYTEPTTKVANLDLYDDTLGEFSTYYVNNPNRTTNLRIAASKIDGMILMPGEEFSYNDVVGERTVAAGYRNAAIYVNGEVEDGLAGGICQVSSTLYDAVVYANLEVTERYNHARVPSYVTAGRDATVYWGSKDFKFKNNRSYPIKIDLKVENGHATAKILGKRTDNEYEISFESSVVSRRGNYMNVNTYKVYRQNGVVVNREYLYTDSYKT